MTPIRLFIVSLLAAAVFAAQGTAPAPVVPQLASAELSAEIQKSAAIYDQIEAWQQLEETRFIENSRLKIGIMNFRGAIVSVALKDSRSIAEDADPNEPLQVLHPGWTRVLNRTPKGYGITTDMQNYLYDMGLAWTRGEKDGKVLVYPEEGVWTFLPQSKDTELSLQAEFKGPPQNEGQEHYRYTITYTLPEDIEIDGEAQVPHPHVQVAYRLENLGTTTLEDRLRILPLNGIHQDDAGNESYYLSIVSNFNGEDGHFNPDGFPGNLETRVEAHPETGATYIPASQIDFVALKSRFFAAWWKPGALSITSTEVNAPVVSSGRLTSADLEEGTAEAQGGEYAVQIQSRGFQRQVGSDTYNQASLRLSIAKADGSVLSLQPGQSLNLDWQLVATSMTSKDLESVSDLEHKIEYSDWLYRFFKRLVQLLTFILDGIYFVFRHYGVSVIVLTVLIKAAMHKLNYKQQASMLKMQEISPELSRLKEQYGHDRQAMMQKQMEIFKKHGVNPAGGCLPILLQMPIFIALYQTFSHAADLRGSSFLWVHDLTLPDQLIVFAEGLPLIGDLSLNPLPILYILATLFMSMQHKVPENASDQQKQMAKMMKWMPVLFGVIFYQMPAGLVLYFVCSALIGALETRYIRKKLGADKK